jgi:hypothetical protein
MKNGPISSFRIISNLIKENKKFTLTGHVRRLFNKSA